MPKKKRKHFLEAIATLTGMVIGAGILGIPYVIAKSGFLTGLIDLVIIGLAILVLNLYVGEIVLRTKEKHQLTGYAKKYLGKWGKRLMMFSMVFGLYGALIAYTIKEGEFFDDEKVEIDEELLGEINKRAVEKMVKNVKSREIKYKEEKQKSDIEDSVSELENLLG